MDVLTWDSWPQAYMMGGDACEILKVGTTIWNAGEVLLQYTNNQVCNAATTNAQLLPLQPSAAVTVAVVQPGASIRANVPKYQMPVHSNQHAVC
jgi:hypothetical protein